MKAAFWITGMILKITIFLALTVASLAFVTVGAAAPEKTIELASKEGLGDYLVDQDGMALYYFAEDTPRSGTSSCGDTCTVYWPPFHTGQIVLPMGLSSFDFSTITREDGLVQITYKGWPLYYYTNDYRAGEIKGHGMYETWFVAGPDMMP
ncbi:hypothetical protein P0O24_00575 [Methanotrichaceae archaeon M04Ac]|uniref:Lipoprotein n=1 Tax=Candidatus Methanocrinis alkalitolerans TaxID=3033395 RepID=A0ABT5XBQ0_9EURY|nr:hypothetical protein [Candidatus Methanocrinis alkalitolerans]MCR3884773.1 hypothetical protein [Methanothrix sp.]MDF0592082.1 hypothetical protein [Candidatus Methanocrinis alkalitolerans]